MNPSLFTIFFSFFKLGATAFGGPAMVSYIITIAVEKKKWLRGSIFKYGVSICQMIPVTTTMQVAAFVGLKVRDVKEH